MRDKAERVWCAATRLHFNLDFQLNSQSLAACLTPEPALGGSAWPNYRLQKPGDEYALALWANTTLGLLSFWWKGVRQQAGRARLTITALPDLVTLDPRELDAGQKRKARQLFREFASRAFLPANEAYRDASRKPWTAPCWWNSWAFRRASWNPWPCYARSGARSPPCTAAKPPASGRRGGEGTFEEMGAVAVAVAAEVRAVATVVVGS